MRADPRSALGAVQWEVQRKRWIFRQRRAITTACDHPAWGPSTNPTMTKARR